MAPSSRKGGSKAAAAAAARKQWKVGDLVLAKVKGFPAWPATVSEPEKWGYSADWKKVLVYFFGTKQIAFCNHADVEAFTEEKKESLLIKRHRKGADFVRAVHEIIDSYEEMKKQDQVADFNNGDEIIVAKPGNLGNPSEPLDAFGLKDQSGVPEDAIGLCLKAAYSNGEKGEPSVPDENAVAANSKSIMHDKEPSSEEPIGSVVTEKPLAITYTSRRRSGGVQPQNIVTQKRAPSTRRARSLLRADSNRLQRLIPPSNNGSEGGGTTAMVLREGLVRRNTRIQKSPHVSEGHHADSSAFVSNGSLEENGSEIVTVESDAFSLNECSTVESGCQLLQSESVMEYCNRDIELTQTLDFRTTRSSFTKKKRKPNRKRVINNMIELTGGLEKEIVPETEAHISQQVSPSAHEFSSERCSKEDGDEHLPLVKRARVRMGRLSSAGEELNTLTQVENKPSEVFSSIAGHICTSLNSSDDCSVDKNSLLMERGLGVSSPPNKCSQGLINKPRLWEDKKHEQSLDDYCSVDKNSLSVERGLAVSSPPNKCSQGLVNKPKLWEDKKHQQSLDGEAALPPSKRLHRAFEAMSANVAEDGQTCLETPSTVRNLINGSCIPSPSECSKVSVESQQDNGFGVQTVVSLNNNVPKTGLCGFSTSSSSPEPGEHAKPSLELAVCNAHMKNSISRMHEVCEDKVDEAVACPNEKDLSRTDLGTQAAQLVVIARSPISGSPKLGRKQGSFGCSEVPSNGKLPVEEECENESPQLSIPIAEQSVKELDPSEHLGRTSDTNSRTAQAAEDSPQIGTNLNLDNGERACETTRLAELPLYECNKVSKKCEIEKETEAAQVEFDATLSSSIGKVMVAVVPNQPHQSCSESIPEVHLGETKTSDIRTSSSPTYGSDSAIQQSPPNKSSCNFSTSDNCTSRENNGCCSSLEVQLHHEKPKVSGKWSNRAEGMAALQSFETTLGTLTRTKESIGRATRIAIDCARFGFAAKVLEILACTLEKESSLHRRVDLFFLVDSITQCSRGMKGDVKGGIYPSAIQAVLPRLLSAAAPPGSSTQENRRQCLKVLKLWLERRILPESVLRHHIRDLDSLNTSSTSGPFCRRPMRTERAFHDPVREMEGMHVDEYGSNSSFQLPGFCMPPMLKDEDGGSDSDGGSFEAVTPEHNNETPEEREIISIPAMEKHRLVLKDVDGELEMEDVAPGSEAGINSTNNVAKVNILQTSHHHSFEQHRFPRSFAPPLPMDVPPSSPPLPTSPPPLPLSLPLPLPLPPLPPPPPLSSMAEPDSNAFMGTYNKDGSQQRSVVQQSGGPSVNSIVDVVHYNVPEGGRDHQMLPQIHDPISSCSFSNIPASHPTIRPVNNSAPQTDGAAYHLRPPHPAPSDQFSYVQTNPRVQTLREVVPPPPPPPPPYINRFGYPRNSDGGGSFHSGADHDRMKLGPHEQHEESWRFSGHSVSGSSYYPDSARMSYAAPAPYICPPCDPPLPNHRWDLPPRAINAVRAPPSFWQQPR